MATSKPMFELVLIWESAGAARSSLGALFTGLEERYGAHILAAATSSRPGRAAALLWLKIDFAAYGRKGISQIESLAAGAGAVVVEPARLPAPEQAEFRVRFLEGEAPLVIMKTLPDAERSVVGLLGLLSGAER